MRNGCNLAVNRRGCPSAHRATFPGSNSLLLKRRASADRERIHKFCFKQQHFDLGVEVKCRILPPPHKRKRMRADWWLLGFTQLQLQAQQERVTCSEQSSKCGLCYWGVQHEDGSTGFGLGTDFFACRAVQNPDQAKPLKAQRELGGDVWNRQQAWHGTGLLWAVGAVWSCKGARWGSEQGDTELACAHWLGWCHAPVSMPLPRPKRWPRLVLCWVLAPVRAGISAPHGADVLSGFHTSSISQGKLTQGKMQCKSWQSRAV